MTDEEGKTKADSHSKPKVRVIAPIEGLDTRAQVAPTRVSYSLSPMCAYHPHLHAVYICAQCQRPLCGSCATPYGQLFICSSCYQPPPPVQTQTQRKPPEKPPLESILGLFGGLLIIVGFILPWVTNDFVSPGIDDNFRGVISGFVLAGDYAEVILVLTMGILIMVVEFILLVLTISPSMIEKPPVGVKIVPMFLAFVTFIVLVEILIRAEGFAANISGGWFVCLIGSFISMWPGAVSIKKEYFGED
jgi:hypothetical protein